MQRSFVKFLMVVLIPLLLVGCKKEVKETRIISSLQNSVKADNGNKIRLTFAGNQFRFQTFSYNDDGLVNEWYYSDAVITTRIEYHEGGRLFRALVYFGPALAYTVYFVYEKNQVVKETWYNGNSNDIADEVFYSFDANGSMLRLESFMQQYYVAYEYTNDRQLSSLIVYLNVVPLFKIDYTYLDNFKNPYNAVPGLPYAFLFTDGIWYANKLYSTSSSAIFYDEFGIEIFRDIQDPALTTMEPGPEHYPASSSYYNTSFDLYFDYTFTYENCGTCPTGKNGRSSVTDNSLKSSLNKFLVRNPKHQMKERAAELRMELRKFKG